MTNLPWCPGYAAKADNMINPAVPGTMIGERAPDIVEALNDMPPELAVTVLLHLPPRSRYRSPRPMAPLSFRSAPNMS
jgi:hypothetical protein